MKHLIILLAPIFIYAQNTPPDILYLISSKELNYTFNSIDVDREGEEIFYEDNISSHIALNAVNDSKIENPMVIYKQTTEFYDNLNEIKNFMNKQNEKTNRFNNALMPGEINQTESSDNFLTNKKWSIGVNLVPYYSGETYGVFYSSDPSDYLYLTSNTFNEINLEWYLNYSVSKKFDLVFDFSYTSDYSEERNVSSENYNYGTINRGTFQKNGMKKINLHLSVKYYLFDKEQQSVNVYFLAGFGRQFAFADKSSEYLFPDPGLPVKEDNMEEYLEDINSPWHLNAGFGTEYFFNNSISLTSSIRFLYASASGKYKVRMVSPSYTRTAELESTLSKLITRIGIGLNFYF